MLDSLYRRSPPPLQHVFLNAYAWQVSRHRYGAAYRSSVAEFSRHERWSVEELRRYQTDRLREVVKAAAEGSSYYRALLQARGMNPSDIRRPEDVSGLPLLTRDIIRERVAELLTRRRPGRGWLAGHTSGTTGSPIPLWYDRNTCVITNTVDRRQKAWAGMGPDEWIGIFLGRMVVSPSRARPPYWQTNRVHRQVWFSTYHMREQELGAYVAEIRRRGLRYLEGYPSTLFILAKWLLRNGETLPLRAVFTTSETTHPAQREAMRAAFLCPTFDYYGLAERVLFATECEAHEGKHLAEDFGYGEVVDEAGRAVPDGQPGYLVGTSLHNTAMPMIRYRTTDVSSVLTEPCSCGRPMRRIRNLVSRQEDIVITPDERILSPLLVNFPIDVQPEILLSKMIQTRVDQLLLRLVVSDRFSAADERSLLTDLATRVGPEMKIDIEYVDDIPREASGKFRWFVSHVQHPYQLSWEEMPCA